MYNMVNQGEDLEGLMNFVTALLCCRATTDAGIDFSVQASPLEQSSPWFAFPNSIITPRWQQDKGEATTQLFMPCELLCNNQQWWTPAWQAWIFCISEMLSADYHSININVKDSWFNSGIFQQLQDKDPKSFNIKEKEGEKSKAMLQ